MDSWYTNPNAIELLTRRSIKFTGAMRMDRKGIKGEYDIEVDENLKLNIENEYFNLYQIKSTSILNLSTTENYELYYLKTSNYKKIVDLNYDYIMNAKGVDKLNQVCSYYNLNKEVLNGGKGFSRNWWKYQ